MAKPSKKQDEIVERVMHEYKQGELETSAGRPVKNRRQAVAIALSEAGESNRVSPAENRRRQRKTESNERAAGGEAKAALYAEAKRRNVPGRSTMSKAALAKALGR